MTGLVARGGLAAAALAAVYGSPNAALAFDDRYPHLWRSAPAATEQVEAEPELVPMPRRAPHRSRSASPAVPVAPEPVATEATAKPAEPKLAPIAERPVQPAPPVVAYERTPAPTAFASPAATLSARFPAMPAAQPAAAAAVAAPAPQPAPIERPSGRAATFNERFTFVVTIDPVDAAAASRDVTAAIMGGDIPLPRAAPKRIRTIPVTNVEPFARISGDLASLIEAKAKKHGVPLALAHAVVHVESTYNPNVTGRGGTHGLMQIKYNTAKGMGFQGSVRDLYDPATNLEYGMRYLAGAHRLARGDVCGTVMRYQGGHRATRMSSVAVRYCSKVNTLLARRTDPSAPVVARNSAPSAPRVAQAAAVALPPPPSAPSGRTASALSFQ